MSKTKYAGRGSVARVAKDLMSRKVRISGYLHLAYGHDSIQWMKVERNLAGWVTGVRRIGHCGYPTVLLVVLWPDRNPVHVPPEWLEVDDSVRPCSLRTWPDSKRHNDDREVMRDIAQRSPRDERGRFISGPLIERKEENR